MSETSTPSRALVLGGGGSTGNAWLIGVIAGLHEAGTDATTADLVVGTSAGATAAAMIASEARGRLLADATAPVAPRMVAAGPPSTRMATEAIDRNVTIAQLSTDLADFRRRMGAAALERLATSDGAWQQEWRTIVASRLPSQHWPHQQVAITAVNATTGDGVVFDRDSGVELADAVAASTSSGFPYRIGEEFYIDGGYRTNAENADLASGFDRVLVLAPFGGRSLVRMDWTVDLSSQVADLRAEGSRVETVFPDAESEHLFGPNGMDLALRPAAARAGFAQGLALASEVAEFWS